jgi:hypothetical protein
MDDRFLVLQDGDDIWLKRIHSKGILEKRNFVLKSIVQRSIQLLDFMLDSLSEKESLTIYLGEFKEQIDLLWDASETESDSFQQLAALLKLAQRQLKVSTVSKERLNTIQKILLGIEANKTTSSDLWHYEKMLEKAGIEVVVSIDEDISEI